MLDLLSTPPLLSLWKTRGETGAGLEDVAKRGAFTAEVCVSGLYSSAFLFSSYCVYVSVCVYVCGKSLNGISKG